VKRIVLLFVIGIGGLAVTSRPAHAQRSGTMQVSARVLDTRDSRASLHSAHVVAVDLLRSTVQTPVTVETALARVSVQMTNRESALDRPRAGSITINYLRN
jgi:hypothetical protein